MKTLFTYFTMLFVFSMCNADAQKNATDYLKQLPADLKLDASIKRSYKMTTDYYDYNLKGNFIGKRRLEGTITYGLDGGLVNWEDVYISKSKDLNAPYPQGTQQEFLQNFRYKPGAELLNESFYKDLPEADVFIKNMFWDMLGFDSFAYTSWDSLELNKEFYARNYNWEIDIAGMGTFENKDIRLTWLGITEMNDEVCAIIKYSAMNNPLKMDMENMSMTGRSHYWGEIYVSLKDKQVEYVTLTEDVLTDVKLKSQPNNIIGYTVRTINVSRTN